MTAPRDHLPPRRQLGDERTRKGRVRLQAVITGGIKRSITRSIKAAIKPKRRRAKTPAKRPA